MSDRLPPIKVNNETLDTLLSAMDVLWLGDSIDPPNLVQALDLTDAIIYGCGAAQDLRALDQVEQTMRGLQTAIKNCPDYSPDKRQEALEKLGSWFDDVMMVKANIHEKALAENNWLGEQTL